MTDLQTRQKLLQLEALHELGRALNTLMPERDLLEEMLHRGMATLDAAGGFAVTVDRNLAVEHALGAGVELPADPAELLGLEMVRRAMLLREPVMSPSESLAGLDGGSLIAPMVSGDAILGVVALAGKERRTGIGSFSEDDRRFLDSMASIGAAAIENSRNYHRLEMVRESLEDENRALKLRMQKDYSDRLMIGDSPRMQRVIDLVARVAGSNASVLIRGESGTGKEMVARLIHESSPRSQRPFVAINCAALPEALLEAELFGIERGVATGVEARPGRFEIASGGTILLDEVGDMPPSLQSKLLRVLQEREVEKLGARKRVPVDVRVLAATHQNLEKMIEEKRFREDLYYRLKVVEIDLPPLRERREDIAKLVRFFLDKYGEREGLSNVTLTHEALQRLLSYPYPGNVRELENMIEGALALTLDPVIDVSDLPLSPTPLETVVGAVDLTQDWPTLETLTRDYVSRTVEHLGGNVSKAARVLDVDRKTIYRKLEK